MDRFDRSRRFFGSDGLAALRRTPVAVVGAGGTGSPLLLQLAYHGVRNIAVIEPDDTDVTSRNRLVGLWASDPDEFPKTESAKRLVHLIDPAIEVSTVHAPLASADGRAAIHSAEWVFGCVDDDGARLQLTEICCQRNLAYIDLATGIHMDESPPVYGGRVCVSVDGRGCPYCLGLLDQDEINASLASAAERAERAEIYGVDRRALAGPGPAVIHLNSLTASLAVNEFTAAVTGLRPPRRVLTFRGEKGVVLASDELGEPGCYYCDLRRQAAPAERAAGEMGLRRLG